MWHELPTTLDVGDFYAKMLKTLLLSNQQIGICAAQAISKSLLNCRFCSWAGGQLGECLVVFREAKKQLHKGIGSGVLFLFIMIYNLYCNTDMLLYLYRIY